jgi:hypothetical protein
MLFLLPEQQRVAMTQEAKNILAMVRDWKASRAGARGA